MGKRSSSRLVDCTPCEAWCVVVLGDLNPCSLAVADLALHNPLMNQRRKNVPRVHCNMSKSAHSFTSGG